MERLKEMDNYKEKKNELKKLYKNLYRSLIKANS